MGLFDFFGIPQGEIKNSAGETVFPTNPVERFLQGTDAPTKDFVMAFSGGLKAPGQFRTAVQEHPYNGTAQIRSVDYPNEYFELQVKPDEAVYPGMTMLSGDLRGIGLGGAMYRKAIDYAASKGLPFRSDGSVSSNAVRVYESLRKQGYDVTEMPGTVTQKSGGKVNHEEGYVFQVTPPGFEAP